jgi:hypothetical protein
MSDHAKRWYRCSDHDPDSREIGGRVPFRVVTRCFDWATENGGGWKSTPARMVGGSTFYKSEDRARAEGWRDTPSEAVEFRRAELIRRADVLAVQRVAHFGTQRVASAQTGG